MKDTEAEHKGSSQTHFTSPIDTMNVLTLHGKVLHFNSLDLNEENKSSSLPGSR